MATRAAARPAARVRPAREPALPANRTIRAKFAKETTGAIRYTELDGGGNMVLTDEHDAIIGSFYLRRAAIEKMTGKKEVIPDIIEITVAVP
jgi:predicted ribosome quality control (RQC) complex YloA/Tae2 family protein